MALKNQALTTVTAVQSLMSGQTDEEKVSRVINAVSEAMARVAGGRTWYYSTTHTETVASQSGQRIWVSAPPIAAITSIKLLGTDGSTLTTYDAAGYTFEGDGSLGSIVNDGGWPITTLGVAGYGNFPDRSAVTSRIEVVYTGGWTTPWQLSDKNAANLISTMGTTPTLPSDLEQACIDEVVSKLRGLGRDRGIETQTTEGTVTTFARPRRGIGDLSPTCYEVARRYWLGP